MWLNRGVDDVRLDAVKHMNTSFTTALTSDIENRLGRDVFFFGEWMDAGAWATGLNTQGQTFANTSGSSLLDFGYRSTMESVLGSGSMQTLASYLTARESYWTEPLKQVVFLDNHDMPRINTVLRSSGMSESFAQQRTDLGLAITMTVRGVPCIYYGTEHYAANFTTNSFGQSGSDPYNREMMPSFNTNTNAFNIIKSLSALKQTNKALQNGSSASNTWPGSTMTSVGNDWYKYVITGASSSNIIFTDGTTQTADLSRSADGWFVPTGTVNNKIVGTWSNSNPEGSSSNGTLSINVISGSNSENISFPGDANNWSLTANTMTLSSNSSSSITIANVISASNIALGNNSSLLELKLVSNSSWDNQWSFGTWTKTSNITFSDSNRQICIDCIGGDNVVLTIDIANLTLTAVVN